MSVTRSPLNLLIKPELGVTQIAGLVARRICLFYKGGRELGRGRAVWLDPFWQPFGHLPARGRGACCWSGTDSGGR